MYLASTPAAEFAPMSFLAAGVAERHMEIY
jgi:hypothetical protein